MSPAQRESDLLFPALHGGFRARSVLDKRFKAVAGAMGLGKRITPRGMRRTFQDLCRAAAVGDLVTRSISGHATEAMQRHYSTATLEEQSVAA
jgi:integrase